MLSECNLSSPPLSLTHFVKMPSSTSVLRLLLASSALLSASSALRQGECEVCVSVVTRFEQSLAKEEKGKTDVIEQKFKDFCKDLKLKENRFVSLNWIYWHSLILL